jgi:RNA polymerase sigma factor (TIGR02999 family)
VRPIISQHSENSALASRQICFQFNRQPKCGWHDLACHPLQDLSPTRCARMAVVEAKCSDSLSADELLQLVYSDLRRLAARTLARERTPQTLDATALVHEAYLRLFPREPADGDQPSWNGRNHFFAAAAQAMRRILIERARRKASIKHGGEWRRIDVDDLSESEEDARLLALDDALSSLAAEDPQAARIVELHHFAGLSHDLVAQVMEITVYQARQLWNYAQAWLRDALKD